MDRFEAVDVVSALVAKSHLHSSMDRFEAFEEYVTRNINKLIYIPVWIDLKQSWQWKTAQSRQIYIPVWIDLKVSSKFISIVAALFTFQYG